MQTANGGIRVTQLKAKFIDSTSSSDTQKPSLVFVGVKNDLCFDPTDSALETILAGNGSSNNNADGQDYLFSPDFISNQKKEAKTK